MLSKKDQHSTLDSKPLLDLNSPAFVDQLSEAILGSTALFYSLIDNLQWLFDNAHLMDRDAFLEHTAGSKWLSDCGFLARPWTANPNSGEVDFWEILCPAAVHKTRVSTKFLTEFIADLPEGTKINIGGFTNV